MNPYNIFRFVPLAVLNVLARFVAWIIMSMSNLSVHNTIRKNLLLAYPSLSKEMHASLHKNIIKNQCLTSVESVKSWAMPPKWSVEQIKQIHNQEILTAGLNNPNGMLAIVPHLGTWEMMNAWLNQYGSPTIMYKPVKGKLSNDFVLQGRERLNATLVPTDGTGVKAVFKTLKQGGFSIILPDHVPAPSGGVNVPFFGVPTRSSTLASKLASKTKCALVGLTCIRRDDGKGFDIHCYDLNDEKLYDKDMEISTLAMNDALEQMISPISEHYMWGYRRFKYIPDLNNVYKQSPQDFETSLKKIKEMNLTSVNTKTHKTPQPTVLNIL